MHKITQFFLSIQSVFYCGDHRNIIGDVDGMYVRI